MTRRAHILLLTVLLALASGVALGAERFPPPDFESGHAFPETQYAPPRADVWEYVDVAVLVVALALATVLALKVRRRWALFLLMLASLAYFGFWREGCVCPIGSIQNVALAVFDSGYAVPLAVVAFFLLPLVATLLFGRTFCAAVCPLGAVQDLVVLRPLRVPGWLEHGLRVLAVVYLGLAVLFAATGSAFVICEYDPFVAFFRLSGSAGMLLLGGCMLGIGVFVGRPYCRFLCPYGVVLGWLSRLSRWRVTITPDECVQCRLCEDSCPFGAIQPPSQAPLPTEVGPGTRRTGWMLLLLPALVAGGVGLFGLLATPLSRMHPRVRQAERVWLEDKGHVEGEDDMAKAFRRTDRPPHELHAEALALRADFALGARLVGAFVGLIVGLRLLHLSVRRTRTDYEADRGLCIACGRCFAYCPIERKRRKGDSDG